MILETGDTNSQFQVIKIVSSGYRNKKNYHWTKQSSKNMKFSVKCKLRKDLKILKEKVKVKEEIGRYAEKYKERKTTHPNQLATEASKTLIKRKLKRKHPTDLAKEIK